MIGALRFALAIGLRVDRVRALLAAAVAILEPVTGVGLAILLGLLSEVAAGIRPAASRLSRSAWRSS